jgi:hypothetical protein
MRGSCDAARKRLRPVRAPLSCLRADRCRLRLGLRERERLRLLAGHAHAKPWNEYASIYLSRYPRNSSLIEPLVCGLRRMLSKEVACRIFPLKAFEPDRLFSEIEAVRKIVRSNVSAPSDGRLNLSSTNFKVLPNSCWLCEMYPAFAYGDTTISGTRKPSSNQF